MRDQKLYSAEEVKRVCYEQALRFKLDEPEKQRKPANEAGNRYHRAREAENVLRNRMEEVSIKFVSPFRCFYLDQDVIEHHIESIVSLEWPAYLERENLTTEGPLLFWFDDCREKMARRCNKGRVLQKAADCGRTLSGSNITMNLGGYMAVSCYHIGSYEDINNTYRKILCWIDIHGYQCGGEVIERCLSGYWTGEKEEYFVTEILIPVTGRRQSTASGKEE